MIINLRIKNVALIDEVEVAFGEGLNVLTGETGAGKSIVVDSINFMLGERPARDFLRSGAETASVEGLLDVRDDACLNALRSFGFEADGELMLQRIFTAQGKSVCRVNGRTVTVGMLKEISALLVDVHGQHEHQSLLDTNKQLSLLDQFCGGELETQKKYLEQQLRLYRENGRAIKALSGFGNERETQLEMWQFQLNEIQNAKLKQGEEEELLARRARLGGLEKLSRATSEALALLAGSDTDMEGAAIDKLGRAAVLAADIARIDSTREPLAESMNDAAALLSDIIGELRAYTEELDADPRALESVEARLDVIYRLKKKYGPTVADVLAHFKDVTDKTERMLGSGEELKRLNAARRAIVNEITQACRCLSDMREQTANKIQAQIVAVLRDLGMKNAQFAIRVEQKKEFSAEGNNRVEFMISPNPGEPLKPLNRIASGGEMSRVMLAVKTVLADADRIGTLIFDEVDTGVSGRTAQQVAEKLMGIARGRQILCITHLPQIAAMADVHFLIEKKTDGEKTVTSVRAQDNKEIIQELARLIGGAKITEATINAAHEMKEQANQLKRTSAL